MDSREAQPEGADAKLKEGAKFMVSRSTLSKLDSFRYQDKYFGPYQPPLPPGDTGYHLVESNSLATLDPSKDTASFQDQNHVARFVPTLDSHFGNNQPWDHYEDEFLPEDIHIDDPMGLFGGQRPTEPSASLDLPSQGFQVNERSFPERVEESKATSAGEDIFILKDKVYVPVQAMTTMGALKSSLGTGQVSQHARANIGRKLTSTNIPETEVDISKDHELFDLEEEDEMELANLTGAISQDAGPALWCIPMAPSTPPAATSARPCAPDSGRSTFVVQVLSPPAQQPLHSTSDCVLEPFVRPPFPKRVHDRSPIFGISSSGALRTCFRIGEALNAASAALRTGTDVIIELFARVSASTREQAGYKQRIEFADIFHSERPPFLSGTYDLWKDGGRWEEESRVFLDEYGTGKICRAVGRLKKDKDTKMWKMAVLNIQQASWDDVAWVKGIVCA